MVHQGEHITPYLENNVSKPLHQTLLSDLDSLGRKASLVTVLNNCRKVFMQSFANIFDKSSARQLFDSAARTAISASHIIFLVRKSGHWPVDKPLLN